MVLMRFGELGICHESEPEAAVILSIPNRQVTISPGYLLLNAWITTWSLPLPVLIEATTIPPYQTALANPSTIVGICN